MKFFTQKKKYFCDILKKKFLQTYMLDFREIRSQMKGHGAPYLFKQKTLGKYETKVKHT